MQLIMATVSAKVYADHEKKGDGTFNVKILVHHKRRRSVLCYFEPSF